MINRRGGRDNESRSQSGSSFSLLSSHRSIGDWNALSNEGDSSRPISASGESVPEGHSRANGGPVHSGSRKHQKNPEPNKAKGNGQQTGAARNPKSTASAKSRGNNFPKPSQAKGKKGQSGLGNNNPNNPKPNQAKGKGSQPGRPSHPHSQSRRQAGGGVMDRLLDLTINPALDQTLADKEQQEARIEAARNLERRQYADVVRAGHMPGSYTGASLPKPSPASAMRKLSMEYRSPLEDGELADRSGVETAKASPPANRKRHAASPVSREPAETLDPTAIKQAKREYFRQQSIAVKQAAMAYVQMDPAQLRGWLPRVMNSQLFLTALKSVEDRVHVDSAYSGTEMAESCERIQRRLEVASISLPFLRPEKDASASSSTVKPTGFYDWMRNRMPSTHLLAVLYGLEDSVQRADLSDKDKTTAVRFCQSIADRLQRPELPSAPPRKQPRHQQPLPPRSPSATPPPTKEEMPKPGPEKQAEQQLEGQRTSAQTPPPLPAINSTTKNFSFNGMAAPFTPGRQQHTLTPPPTSTQQQKPNEVESPESPTTVYNAGDPNDHLLDMAELPTSLYVSGLHQDVSESVLFVKFSTVGAVDSIKIGRDPITRRSLGYAYVTFQRPEEAERALASLTSKLVLGAPMRISKAPPPPPGSVAEAMEEG